MPLNEFVTLLCSACGRTFEKPRSTLAKHNLVACPHCATLQAARLASQNQPPGAGTAHPTWRKGP